MRPSLPTDAEIAALCNGIYAYPGYQLPKWKKLSLAPADSFAVSYGIAAIGAVDILVFRGSTTLPDWIRDAEAFADPIEDEAERIKAVLHRIVGFRLSEKPLEHAFLGAVHPGFLKGLPQVVEEVLPELSETFVVAGHSLGAGEACIATGLFVHAGRPPARRVCFGEPRPGFPQLAELIANVPAASYRNGDAEDPEIVHDMITDVPFPLGPEDYVHPCPLTDVSQEPTGTMFERWGPFGWHGMPLYLEALEKLEGRSSSLKAALMKAPELAAHQPIH